MSSRMEILVGRVLRVGVTTSSICLAMGLVLSTINGNSGAAYILLTTGLVVLMATPVVRVMVSVVEYALERDWTFVTLTSIVLVELLASVVAAFR